MTTVTAIVIIVTAALCAGLLGYILMKYYFQYKKDLYAFTKMYQQDKGILKERLAAYERMTLFLDRISIPQLLLRLASNESNPDGLMQSLMISIQKEYEYNAPQQLYFSDELWKIITLAKNEALAFIQETAAQPEVKTADQLQALLLSKWNEIESNPIQIAQSAIRKEAALYLH